MNNIPLLKKNEEIILPCSNKFFKLKKKNNEVIDINEYKNECNSAFLKHNQNEKLFLFFIILCIVSSVLAIIISVIIHYVNYQNFDNYLNEYFNFGEKKYSVIFTIIIIGLITVFGIIGFTVYKINIPKEKKLIFDLLKKDEQVKKDEQKKIEKEHGKSASKYLAI